MPSGAVASTTVVNSVVSPLFLKNSTFDLTGWSVRLDVNLTLDGGGASLIEALTIDLAVPATEAAVPLITPEPRCVSTCRPSWFGVSAVVIFGTSESVARGRCIGNQRSNSAADRQPAP